MDAVEILWKPVRGFENFLISNTGLVFNDRRKTLKKPGLDPKGYLRVRLMNGPKAATKKVHRLVAEAFLASYSEDLMVNHKNTIKTDNIYTNLEMVTNAQNIQHAWDNNLMRITKRDSITGKFTK